MSKPAKAKDDPLIGAVERSIRAVLSSSKAKPAEKAKARADAIRLLEVKHKITEGDDDAGFFN